MATAAGEIGKALLRAMPQARIRVLTVDDDPLVREGLAAVINSDPEMQVVADAATGPDALDQYRKHRPDVVTLDLLLADVCGIELSNSLLSEFPGARIVAVTRARGYVQILRALENGVRGVVLRGMQHCELIDSIRRVHAGGKAIPSQVAAMLAEHMGDEDLSQRELQVLRLVAYGNQNKQVAAELNIAEETARMHIKHILSKLRAHDRTHAVTIALVRGFLQLDESGGRLQ